MNSTLDGTLRLPPPSVMQQRTAATDTADLVAMLSQNTLNIKSMTQNEVRKVYTGVFSLIDTGRVVDLHEPLITDFIEAHKRSIDEKKLLSVAPELTDVVLKIMCLDRGEGTWIDVDHLSKIASGLMQMCESDHVEQNSNIHKIFPLLASLARITAEFMVPNLLLGMLETISQKFYFHSSASPALQTTSCMLLSSIFKKHPQRRKDIIVDVFLQYKKTQGVNKTIIVSGNARRSILALSRMYMELVHCDHSQETIQFIIRQFVPDVTTVDTVFERFVEDICLCLTHPAYPAAEPILNWILASCFRLMKEKTKAQKMIIRIICHSLTTLCRLSKRSSTPVSIVLPADILSSLPFTEEQDIIKMLDDCTLFKVIDEGILMEIGPQFLQKDIELVVSQMIIVLHLMKQIQKREASKNSLQMHYSIWSECTQSQYVQKCIETWSRGTIRDTIAFEWTYDIAETLELAIKSKGKMIQGLPQLIQHLLKCLDGKGASTFAQIMKAFSSLIDIDPSIMNHPLLVAQLSKSLHNPSPSVREAVLGVLSSYLVQIDQSNSPYYPCVVACLKDKSVTVVKQALSTIKSLLKHANEEEVLSLASVLTTKMTNNSAQISTLASQILGQVLKNDLSMSLKIIKHLLSQTNAKPEWFSHFFKELYLSDSKLVKELIDTMTESIVAEPTYHSVRVLVEFCTGFPKLCAKDYDILCLVLLSAEATEIISLLPEAISPLIPYVISPSISQTQEVSTRLIKLISTKGSTILRPCVKLLALINEYIILDDTKLEEMFEQFYCCLKERQMHKKSLIMRSLYGVGCIFRYRIIKTKPDIAKEVIEIVSSYFKEEDPAIQNMVLTSLGDICSADPTNIEAFYPIMKEALRLGVKQQQNVISFLRDVSNVSPSLSAHLVQNLLPTICRISIEHPDHLMSHCVFLLQTVLKLGMVNPSAAIPTIGASLVLCKDNTQAHTVIESSVFTYGNQIIGHILEGLKTGYEHSKSVLHYDSLAFYESLSTTQRTFLINNISDTLEDSLTQMTDVGWIDYLIRATSKIRFQSYNEPSHLLQKLTSPSFSTTISACYSDCKDPSTPFDNISFSLWTNCIRVLKLRQWISKKYHISHKNIQKSQNSMLKVNMNVGDLNYDLPSVFCKEIHEAVLKAFQNAIKEDRMQ